MGSATVIADLTMPGDTSQVAARLLDVGPDGKETLVSRGIWRPASGGPTRQVFQLFPNGWTFAEGHVPKLELLPKDTNAGLAGGYARASNDQQPITVSDLQLRLPVIEKPGSFKGLVGVAAKRILPKGYELAADFAALKAPHPKTQAEVQAEGREAGRDAQVPAALRRLQRDQGDRELEQEGEEAGEDRQGQAQGGRRRQVEEAEAEAERQGPQAAQVGPEAEAQASRSSRPSWPSR